MKQDVGKDFLWKAAFLGDKVLKSDLICVKRGDEWVLMLEVWRFWVDLKKPNWESYKTSLI